MFKFLIRQGHINRLVIRRKKINLNTNYQKRHLKVPVYLFHTFITNGETQVPCNLALTSLFKPHYSKNQFQFKRI